MQIVETEIPGVKILTPKKHGDHRGFFSEVYNANTLKAQGIETMFVQDNHSYSAEIHTLRGLHYQKPPFAQVKIVRILKGAALDIVLDIRKGSPTYGKHVVIPLSAEAWNQVYIPAGCAHGVLTTSPNTEIFYKVSAFYAPECDRGILWSDPALNIKLPVAAEAVILSEKDARQPLFRDADNPFVFEG